MSAERTHFVYEAYDADGLLLYVGCTGNPGQRYKNHMAGGSDARGWFHPFVTNWRVSGPYPKAVAFKMEKRLIDEGQPIWNGHSFDNLHNDRALIEAYLDAHGVCFVESGARRNRPDLVKSPTARRRHLRSVAITTSQAPARERVASESSKAASS